MQQIALGVIGGSGLYHMAGMTDMEEVRVTTPFGEPSDSLIVGTLAGVQVVFVPRHGRGHRIGPTAIPARANLWALKSLGVTHVIAVSAVGSLREEIAPRDLVIPDQLFDRTKGRMDTFFDQGVVAHIAFADPFCPTLSGVLAEAAEGLSSVRVHRGGTYVCIEGPAFSTKAESQRYQQWGLDIIGMTALPEAKLAREAELCYATLACVTDYDSWHATEAMVNVELVIANLAHTVIHAQAVIRHVATHIPDRHACDCANALSQAIITDRAMLSPEVQSRYALLLGQYLNEP
jgi:5'-methylthioadenosine phosphorylase